MHKQEVDYLIVGQGIAGVSMAFRMLEAGKRIAVIDRKVDNSSSKVAAGIINPITGRRYVKSWMFEDLLEEAHRFYESLSDRLNISCFEPKLIIRSLFNASEEQDWWLRRQDETYQPFMSEELQVEDFLTHIRPVYAYGGVEKGGRVRLRQLVEKWCAYLEAEKLLRYDTFSYDKIQMNGAYLEYESIRAKHILFCEGAKAVQNPYFHDLNFRTTKGEVLLVRCPSLSRKSIFKNKIFILPYEEDLFWIGSMYRLEENNEAPTQEAKDQLIELLSRAIDVPFEVVDHRAAIRPTIRDRRPLLGTSSKYPNIHIFNGMGTKGASLAPYFSKHMYAYLEEGQALDPKVDINRFLKEKL